MVWINCSVQSIPGIRQVSMKSTESSDVASCCWFEAQQMIGRSASTPKLKARKLGMEATQISLPKLFSWHGMTRAFMLQTIQCNTSQPQIKHAEPPPPLPHLGGQHGAQVSKECCLWLAALSVSLSFLVAWLIYANLWPTPCHPSRSFIGDSGHLIVHSMRNCRATFGAATWWPNLGMANAMHFD